MAFTYKWSDLVTSLTTYLRNMPISSVSAAQVDWVSSEMWRKYPWREACQTFPTITLLDSTYDYDCPPNFYRLVSGQITRTLPEAESYDPLSVAEALPVPSPITMPPMMIKSFAFERGGGQIRLSLSPSVNSNEAFSLDGQYQQEHTRITNTNTQCWFSDSLIHVAMEGIMYWGYKLSNQFKMAEAQLKIFQAKMDTAWSQEKQGHADVLIPEVIVGGLPIRRGW